MLNPDQIRALIDSAKALTDSGQKKEALKKFQDLATKVDESHLEDTKENAALQADLYIAFSRAHMNLGDFKKAADVAAKAEVWAMHSEDKQRQIHALGNMGTSHSQLSEEYPALEIFQKALLLSLEIDNKKSIAANCGNLGVVYLKLSNYPKALEFQEKALAINEELHHEEYTAANLGNIGVIYEYLSDHKKALEFYQKAKVLNEKLGNDRFLSINLTNIGTAYMHLHQYEKALEFCQKAIDLSEKLGNEEGKANTLSVIGSVYTKLENFDAAFDHLFQARDLAKKIGFQNVLGDTLISIGEAYMLREPADFKQSEANLLEAMKISEEQEFYKEVAACHQKLSELFRRQERWKEADEHFQKYHKINSEIRSTEARRKAEQFAIERKMIEQEKERAIEKAATEARHQATESLLYKVLPGPIAERMINGDDEIADYFPATSILFADIQGFTSLTADVPPYMLLKLLHSVFSRFDEIVKKHSCTKIKTIGDGYLVVAGAPEPCEDHSERIIKAAMEMIQPIEIPEEIKAFLPDDAKLNIRIGIHEGPVVAGIAGQDAFTYDIYSDAVNIASRMESTGEVGRIHVSAEFMRHLLSRFAMQKIEDHGLNFEQRGEIEIKGKGMMKTFFVSKADS